PAEATPRNPAAQSNRERPERAVETARPRTRRAGAGTRRRTATANDPSAPPQPATCRRDRAPAEHDEPAQQHGGVEQPRTTRARRRSRRRAVETARPRTRRAGAGTRRRTATANDPSAPPQPATCRGDRAPAERDE